jgi:transposase
MKIYIRIYIGIDLHSNYSVIGFMDQDGHYIKQVRVDTTAENLQREVARIPADSKQLTIEQGNQALWASEQLAPYVDHLVICNPRYNRLITQSANKNDSIDAHRLCTLLRLGELKDVWRSDRMGDRRLFYQQIKEYEWLNKQLVTSKRRLQATLQHWGYKLKLNKTDYTCPKRILEPLSHPKLASQLGDRLAHISFLSQQKADYLKRIIQAGKAYPEIAEFQKMSGIGPVRAHTFSGYIQTPHRFANRRQLTSFCKLAVAGRSSSGRQLSHEHLLTASHSSLKNLSYGTWHSAMGSDNEVSGFYRASLSKCGNETHARLNTQRKSLITLWSLWKHNWSYRSEKFWAGDGACSR